MGDWGTLPERKNNLDGFQVFLPELSRRKNFYKVREEKTHQKSVEEKTTSKILGEKSSRLSEEKKILDFTRK